MTMPTSDDWYEVAAGSVPLTQGDLIADCPLLAWSDGPPGPLVAGQTVDLQNLVRAYLRDVVVMTQACDLEHGKVANVVLCPTLPLSAYRQLWAEEVVARGQNPTEKSRRRHTDDIRSGYVWNQALLNSTSVTGAPADVRVVSFDQVYTLPRWFLESVLASRGRPRLRLRPPYREHLSQAFARFFMRVGLPQGIALPTA